MKYLCIDCKKKFNRKREFIKHNDICIWIKQLYNETNNNDVSNKDNNTINNNNDSKNDSKNDENILSTKINLNIQLKKINKELKIKDENIELMKTMIKQLYSKYINLENEVVELRKYVNKTKKNINILTWLNENRNPRYSLKDFINNFNYKEKHLQFIFDNNYIDGIYYVFQEIFDINNINQHPICCFKQKSNMFYIWDNETVKWNIMTEKDFNNCICNIDLNIMKQFQLWSKKHNEKIENDDKFHELYLNNMIKVTGGNRNKTQSIKLIRSKIYNYLNMNIKDIIQYNFTF